jgi:hypothetical protein
MVTCILA